MKYKMKGMIILKAIISGLVGGLSAIVVIYITNKINLKTKFSDKMWVVDIIRAGSIGIMTFLILYFVLGY